MSTSAPVRLDWTWTGQPEYADGARMLGPDGQAAVLMLVCTHARRGTPTHKYGLQAGWAWESPLLILSGPPLHCSARPPTPFAEASILFADPAMRDSARVSRASTRSKPEQLGPAWGRPRPVFWRVLIAPATRETAHGHTHLSPSPPCTRRWVLGNERLMEFAKGNAGIERQWRARCWIFETGTSQPRRQIPEMRCELCVVVGRLGIISELKLIKDVDDTWYRMPRRFTPQKLGHCMVELGV
ncbi:hypothetical protein BJ912DRAFT_1040023 [Pholiota molesta]|nr:hypothetical protein BJ912DRAFT_1040023 [Pholiota molesta]